MNATWKIWKIWIIAGLAALFAADLAVGYVLWQSSRQGVESMSAQRDRLALDSKLLKADVARGERIRESLSGVGK
jgi:type IV secretory pathway TrbF-like protein